MSDSLDPQLQLAFSYASDLAKQMISLSTGILALSITFSKEVFTIPSKKTLSYLVSSWIAQLISIICGLWSLMALTGSLAQPVVQGIISRPTSIELNARIPASLQTLFFLLGTALIICYGIFSLRSQLKAPLTLEEPAAQEK